MTADPPCCPRGLRTRDFGLALHLLEQALRAVGRLGLDAAQGIEPILRLQVAAAGGDRAAVDTRDDRRCFLVPGAVRVGEDTPRVAQARFEDRERFPDLRD